MADNPKEPSRITGAGSTSFHMRSQLNDTHRVRDPYVRPPRLEGAETVNLSNSTTPSVRKAETISLSSNGSDFDFMDPPSLSGFITDGSEFAELERPECRVNLEDSFSGEMPIPTTPEDAMDATRFAPACVTQASDDGVSQDQQYIPWAEIIAAGERNCPDYAKSHEKKSVDAIMNEPPPGCVCYRCKNQGHWIQTCLTLNNPDFKQSPRMKRAAFLLETAEKPLNDANASTSGTKQNSLQACESIQAVNEPKPQGTKLQALPHPRKFSCTMHAMEEHFDHQSSEGSPVLSVVEETVNKKTYETALGDVEDGLQREAHLRERLREERCMRIDLEEQLEKERLDHSTKDTEGEPANRHFRLYEPRAAETMATVAVESELAENRETDEVAARDEVQEILSQLSTAMTNATLREQELLGDIEAHHGDAEHEAELRGLAEAELQHINTLEVALAEKNMQIDKLKATQKKDPVALEYAIMHERHQAAKRESKLRAEIEAARTVTELGELHCNQLQSELNQLRDQRNSDLTAVEAMAQQKAATEARLKEHQGVLTHLHNTLNGAIQRCKKLIKKNNDMGRELAEQGVHIKAVKRASEILEAKLKKSEEAGKSLNNKQADYYWMNQEFKADLQRAEVSFNADRKADLKALATVRGHYKDRVKEILAQDKSIKCLHADINGYLQEIKTYETIVGEIEHEQEVNQEKGYLLGCFLSDADIDPDVRYYLLDKICHARASLMVFGGNKVQFEAVDAIKNAFPKGVRERQARKLVEEHYRAMKNHPASLVGDLI